MHARHVRRLLPSSIVLVLDISSESNFTRFCNEYVFKKCQLSLNRSISYLFVNIFLVAYYIRPWNPQNPSVESHVYYLKFNFWTHLCCCFHNVLALVTDEMNFAISTKHSYHDEVCLTAHKLLMMEFKFLVIFKLIQILFFHNWVACSWTRISVFTCLSVDIINRVGYMCVLCCTFVDVIFWNTVWPLQ